jgi:hypothetical protein
VRRPDLGTPEVKVCSAVASTVGGIMTKEVGAATGNLEVSTSPEAKGVEVAVRYSGADEWYLVDGSPIELGITRASCPPELRELHKRLVGHLDSRKFLLLERGNINQKAAYLSGLLPKLSISKIATLRHLPSGSRQL